MEREPGLAEPVWRGRAGGGLGVLSLALLLASFRWAHHWGRGHDRLCLGAHDDRRAGLLDPTTDYGRVIAIAIVVMVIGIGFLSMLIGAAAERFVSRDVAEAEEKLESEVEASEADVLREIEEISERLRRLKAGVRRLQGT